MDALLPKVDRVVLFWFDDDWGRFGRTYEQLALALARSDRIAHVLVLFPSAAGAAPRLCSSSLRYFSPKLTLGQVPWEVSKQGRSIRQRLRAFVLHRRAWSILRRWLKVGGFTSNNTLLWLFPPHPAVDELVKGIPAAKKVAQVMDDFTKVSTDFWLYPYAVEQYPRLGQLVDHIVVTSAANEKKFVPQGPCSRIDMAVDAAFLGQPHAPSLGGRRPVLGYVGWISARTDVELVRLLAFRRPGYDIVLVGPEHESRLTNSGLLALSNVRWLGEVKNADIPSVLATFDVCLIPHLDSDYARSMSPLKLLQYLASGKPVVATDVSGLDIAHDLIRIESDPGRFIEAIDEQLTTDTVAASKQRIEFARTQTWESRADFLFREFGLGPLS